MTRPWHTLPADVVVRELGTDHQRGLGADEVARRLQQYGPNELQREHHVSPLKLFFGQFTNILIIILLVATVLSAVLGEIVDAAIILAIVVFCAVLGFVQEYRAERALEALKRMLTPTITVLRGGREQEVPSRELVPGDVMLLEAGDRIPADARLVEVYSLKCDEAPLTGESFPVEKDPAVLPENTSVGDRKNMALTGTTVAYGRAKAAVTATGMATEFGKIAAEVAAVTEEKTPLEKRTEEIGRWLGVIALTVCLLAVGISTVREAFLETIRLDFVLSMVMFAIALAVAAVPEALAAIVTGALAVGMHEMAKRNALVRKMPAVETLGCTTVICSDKTGTLTKGEMTVRRIFAAGITADVTGAGYAPVGEFSPAGVVLDASVQMLLQAGLLCNDAVLAEEAGRWFVKGDPTEGALVVLAAKAGLEQDVRSQAPRIGEFPFSSERKRMTTVHRLADGRRIAFVKGAPEVILERSTSLLAAHGPRPFGGGEHERILAVNAEMAEGALRVLGFACKELPEQDRYSEDLVERDLVFLGLIGMMDPPRAEAAEAVRVCRQVQIKPIMITGDHRLTAVAVAREIGIYREGDRVLTGEELSKIDDEELGRIVDRVTVYARVSPTDKLKIVKAWKQRGDVVAMTGDGVNDAPALKHADIGVAMGISGTEVAKEAADMVLADDNFATIVRAIERGRWIYDNIKKYLVYLLRANVTEVIVLGGVVMVTDPGFLPLLPAAILFINLATDGPPALALGLSPADPDIMRRPPRDPRESVFSREVLAIILMGVVLESPIFLWVFFDNLANLEVARTKIFIMFVVIELVIALSLRSLRYSIVQTPPHTLLLVSVVVTLLFTAGLIQLPAVREAFGIALPTTADLAATLAIAVVVLLGLEVVKAVIRARTPLAGQAARAASPP